MDSASPIASRSAGQTSDDSGNLFTLFAMAVTFKRAENSLPANWQWGGDGSRYRHPEHPSATGYGHHG
ncbi:hypothetical protein G9464_15930 [Halostella sp. JP-L12]|uniref:hypothetical protein n=1 Tax=Halostella TaxID=1843185 RepID=UPI0013CF3FC9|nr:MULTISPECIES: hypothetical protein [Halostella]NHN49070.1 hypothetical protein [Halostella sp. JP-L12]